MSFLNRSLRITYVLVFAFLVGVLVKPGPSRGQQFRGNNMPGAPLMPPLINPLGFGAVGVGFGGFPVVGFNGFGLGGFGFAGFNGFGLGGFGFNRFGVFPGFAFNGFGFNRFAFNGFGLGGFGLGGFGLGGFGFNGFGFNGFGFNGFGLGGFGFAGFSPLAWGIRFGGGAVNVGIAGIPAFGVGAGAPVPLVGGFAGKGFGGFNGGKGL